MAKSYSKGILWIFGLLLGMAFFKFRYLAESTGLNSIHWDYGSHLAIINDIKNGNWFPEMYRAEASVHSVSKYLPIYHGLVGSHLLAIFVNSLGLSIPASMLFVSDLSLMGALYFLLKIVKFIAGRLDALAVGVFLLFVANYTTFTYEGAYSQVTSSVFYLGFLYHYICQRKKMAVLFLFLAMLCYPDALLWILPVLIWDVLKNESKYYVVSLFFLAILELTLAAVFIGRIPLPGFVSLSLLSTVIILLFVPLDTEKWTNRDVLVISYLSCLVVLTGISFLLVGSISYYVAKLYFWSPVLAILASAGRFQSTAKWRQKTMIVVLLMGLFQYGFERNTEVLNLFVGKTAFSSRDERFVLSRINSCLSPFFFPPENIWPKEMISPYLIAANSYSQSVDIHRQKIQIGSSDSFEIDALGTDISYRGKKVKDELVSRGHCVLQDRIVDPTELIGQF